MTDTRHSHDWMMHEHPNGAAPHVHAGFPPPRHQFPWPRVIIPVVTVLLVLGAVKVTADLAAKPDPPVACQLLGGQWTLWGGWQCG